MEEINLTIQTFGKPDLNALTKSEREKFFGIVLTKIVRLSCQGTTVQSKLEESTAKPEKQC